MTTEQLDELERLEKAATKGPWESFSVDDNGVCYESISSNGLTILSVETELGWPECARSFAGFSEVSDRDFIASLRNACPALISLARIGLAAVEEDQGGGLTAFGQTQARIDAYLARKDG